MIIAYVCDEKYLPYLKKSMASIKRYNKDVKFVILSKEKFAVEGAEVFTFVPDSTLFKFKAGDRMGDGVYYKFYLPLLPFDKVLYIDCDVICQRPLQPLWEIACPFICATESHAYGKTQAAELGLNRYALTGMMLLNLAAMRKANFTERCLSRLRTTQNVRFHDETIINLEFGSKIKFIDKKFNYCRNRRYDIPILESDAYFLHFVGKTNKLDMLDYQDFEYMEPVKQYLKNKSIAIVGNSESILNKKDGAEIEAHDIVIRFNKGFPLAKPEALGRRTDILFLACTLSEFQLRLFNAKLLIKRSGLCGNACHYAIMSYDRRFLKQGVSQPSTGFIAINLCLSAAAKDITLYGFDFFKSPTYYNEQNYKTLHNGQKEAEKVLEYKKYGLVEIK